MVQHESETEARKESNITGGVGTEGKSVRARSVCVVTQRGGEAYLHTEQEHDGEGRVKLIQSLPSSVCVCVCVFARASMCYRRKW